MALAWAPAAAGTPSAKALGRALDELLRKTTCQVGVLVARADGTRLYGRSAARPLVPASNMKLLTTAAALDLLGPDFVHRTRLLRVGEDLVVVGEGDPTLSARFDPDPLLDDAAAAVAAAGLKEVRDLVVDARAFDAARLHPDWEPEDAERWYGAEVSALNLNDNCVDVTVSGGARAAAVRLRPDTRYVRVEQRVRILDSPRGHVFSLLRGGPDKRTILLRGKVYRRAKPYTTSVPVPDPPRFFAAVLGERLAAHGVAVRGAVREATAGERFAGETLWERRAPLPRTLEVTNQRSQNLYAECLFKTLGRRDGRGVLVKGGSWSNGARQVRAWALAHGVRPEELVVRDGSGLARSNRLSPRAVVAVLRAALAGPHARVYLDSLAEAGASGTLRRRLRRLPAGVRLRGKTGTLTGVHALSGVLEGRRGARWLFALIANGKGASRRLLDRAARAIAEVYAQAP